MASRCKLKGELVAVGFPADEARLAAVLEFLDAEEVFSLDDLEGPAFVNCVPRDMWVVLLHCAGASVKSLGNLARLAGIPEEEVCLLEMVAGCRGRLVKRRALDKKPAPAAAAVTEPKAADAVTLLELPASSDLDIASKGPRAAGEVLVAMLKNGMERLPANVLPMVSNICCLHVM